MGGEWLYSTSLVYLCLLLLIIINNYNIIIILLSWFTLVLIIKLFFSEHRFILKISFTFDLSPYSTGMGAGGRGGLSEQPHFASFPAEQ